MKLVTGKVTGGKVEVEGELLEEGSIVTILSRESDGTFALTPAQEVELLRAIEEANQGDVIDGDELLRALSSRQ